MYCTDGESEQTRRRRQSRGQTGLFATIFLGSRSIKSDRTQKRRSIRWADLSSEVPSTTHSSGSGSRLSSARGEKPMASSFQTPPLEHLRRAYVRTRQSHVGNNRSHYSNPREPADHPAFVTKVTRSHRTGMPPPRCRQPEYSASCRVVLLIVRPAAKSGRYSVQREISIQGGTRRRLKTSCRRKR
jgi:hypothetical protein